MGNTQGIGIEDIRKKFTALPQDRRGVVLHRADEVVCGAVGSERFIVLGVGLDHPGEIYAVGEDDELVALSAGLCERVGTMA
jgi:hypothetical protein